MASRLHLSQDDVVSMSEFLRLQRDQGTAPPGIVNDPLGGKGEGLKQAGLGALKFVFNVLDQPKSAITTGLKYAWDEDDKTNPFTGVVQGLLGKKHTSGSELLKDQGITNKLALALGGFAADVALDPLTYVGLAPIKGLSMGDATIQAAKQTAGLVEKGAVAGEDAANVTKALAKSIKEANPTRVKLNVGLPTKKRTLGEGFAVPKPVSELAEKVTTKDTGEKRALMRAFSRDAEQPFGLSQASRVIEGKYSGDMNRAQRALLNIHNMVTPESRKIAALAYENPERYELVKDTPLLTRDAVGGLAGQIIGAKQGTNYLAQAREGGINTIGEYVDWVREQRTWMTEREMEMGMNRHLLPKTQARQVFQGGKRVNVKGRIREWSELADYEKESILTDANKLLPKRVLKEKELDIVRGLNRQLGKAGETYLSPHMMPFEGPNGLMATRAEPVIDIGDSHITATANSFRDRTRAAITRKALETIGVKTDSLEGSELVRALTGNESMGMRWTDVQRGSGQNALINEIAQLPEFKNTVIPEPIQRILNTQERVLTNDDLGVQFMKHFDRIMGHWKALNTTLNPGYMTRNAVGDVIANLADGVTNPMRYMQSHQVLSEIKRNDIVDLAETLRSPDEGLRAFPGAKQGDRTFNIGGRGMTAQEIHHAGIDNGLFSGEIVTEKMRGASSEPFTRATAPDAGAALKTSNIRDVVDKNIRQTGSNALNLAEAKMADVNIARETNQRFAHFIDRYDKEITNGLRDYAKQHRMASGNLAAIRTKMGEEGVQKLEAKAAEIAAQRVRKFNIDYGSLSEFEKKYMKRLVPFYSFFRKNAPLQMSMLVTKPGFMDKYKPTIEMIQNLIGTNDGEGDWMVPDWIRESMPIRLAVAGAQGNIVNQIARFASGATDDTTVFMPMMQGLMPAGDIGTVLGPLQRAVDTGSPWAGFSQAAKNVGNMANPVFKMIPEAATKTRMQSGGPITDWGEWLVGSTLGTPGRLAYTASPLGTNSIRQGVTSAALGPQLRNVDEAAQASEFQRRRNLMNEQNRRTRQNYASQYGLDPDSEFVSNLQTPEIAQMLLYMKMAGRSIGQY